MLIQSSFYTNATGVTMVYKWHGDFSMKDCQKKLFLGKFNLHKAICQYLETVTIIANLVFSVVALPKC